MSAFSDNFWGERCNGFDTLYQNMKYGQQSSKELMDFLRESCTAEETYAKLLTKLAKISGNNHHGAFAPFWVVLKALAEKLSTLHLQLVTSWQDLMKDVQKYNEEQHKKHKAIKDSEASTLETVQSIQQTIIAVAKTQDLYHARFYEYEKAKRESTNHKDLEKAETKCKKACEDYRNNLEKYNNVKKEYERKMISSCDIFEKEEDIHLKHMKNFVDSYTKAWEHQHALIGQVHTEFKVNCSDLTVRKLKNTFINNKTTGTQKLSDLSFKEPDVSNLPPLNTSDGNREIPLLEKPTRTSVGFLGKSKREKKKDKKKRKKDKDDEKTNSVDSPSKDVPAVDQEGYSIRPENPFENEDRTSWYSSSDSESDSEKTKIKVEIKPFSPKENLPSNNVDDIKNSIRDIRLSPSTVRKTGNEPTLRKSTSASDSIGKPGQDLIGFDQFSVFSANSTGKSDQSCQSTGSPDSITNRKPLSRSTTPLNLPPSLPAPPSRTNTQRSTTAAPSLNSTSNLHSVATARPTAGRQSPASASVSPASSVFDRADSVPSLNNVTFNTTSMPIGSSRGPSPLTIGMADNIPLAVAFTETSNAYLKGVESSNCRLKMVGELMLSFPAGIVRAITDNPNPAALTFRVTNTSQIHHILLNKQLLTQDMLKSTLDTFVYGFDMPALLDHLKRQSEVNKLASYFNIDILKYQLKATEGMDAVPLQLVTYWKCEEKQTDFRLDYKYNSAALAKPMALSKVSVILPVSGGVTNMQAQPQAQWNAGSNRAIWKLKDIAPDEPEGSLRAKFDVSSGPSTSCPAAVQFVSEGTTMSGVDFELVGPGYRLSLVKRRVITGKYLSDIEGR